MGADIIRCYASASSSDDITDGDNLGERSKETIEQV